MNEARRLNKRLERSGPRGWLCWDGPWQTAPSRRGRVVWVRRYADRSGSLRWWRVERMLEWSADEPAEVVLVPPRCAARGPSSTRCWYMELHDGLHQADGPLGDGVVEWGGRA